MKSKAIHQILTCCISAIWLINGLFCKLLNLVPRHQEIVARILGNDNSGAFTIAIGCAETAMAIWVLSNIKPRFCAITQIIIIATMNTIEFILAPDLLLWGKANAIFAFILIVVIYLNEFYLSKKLTAES
jgi:hypothetical protein